MSPRDPLKYEGRDLRNAYLHCGECGDDYLEAYHEHPCNRPRLCRPTEPDASRFATAMLIGMAIALVGIVAVIVIEWVLPVLPRSWH